MCGVTVRGGKMLILDTVQPTPTASDLMVISWVIVMTFADRRKVVLGEKGKERKKPRNRKIALTLLNMGVDLASTVDIPHNDAPHLSLFVARGAIR